MADNSGFNDLPEAPVGSERARVEALLRATEALSSGSARAREKKRRTPAQKAARPLLNALFWLLVVALVAVIFSGIRVKRSGEIPDVFGFSLLRIETGSMVPTLPIGSYIVIQKVDSPEDIPEGTIVTFRFENGMVVTHRIIEVLDDPEIGRAYRTKGDNPQNIPDGELLTPDRVIGVFRMSITLPSIWGGEG